MGRPPRPFGMPRSPRCRERPRRRHASRKSTSTIPRSLICQTPILPKGSGPFLVYLDVWKRAITYLEHPELIDTAVGVDTTGRVQMVWQVKLLDVSNVYRRDLRHSGRLDSVVGKPDPAVGCATDDRSGAIGDLRTMLPEYRDRLHRDGEPALSRRNPSRGRRQ